VATRVSSAPAASAPFGSFLGHLYERFEEVNG
jgi:hypothetical protein